REATRRLAESLGLGWWETAQMAAGEPAFDLLPLARAHQLQAALIRTRQGELVAVLHDPMDSDLWTQLAHRAQGPLTCVLAAPDDIHAFLNQQGARSGAGDSLRREADAAPAARHEVEELSLARLSDEASPAVRLVNSTLYDALRTGASDVHLESTPTG